MSRGGKRKGAGRPKGKRDEKPRIKSKDLAKPSKRDLDIFEKFNTKFFYKIKPYLTAEVRKQYEELSTKSESPVECLKIVLYDLMTRYKMGRIQEMRAGKTWMGTTDLANAIKQIAETIDRIESNRPGLMVNILNLIKDDKKYKNESEQLADRIFDLPGEEFKIDDADIKDESDNIEHTGDKKKDKKDVEDKSKDEDKNV